MTQFPIEKLGRGGALAKSGRVFLTPLTHEFTDEIFKYNSGNVRQEFIPFSRRIQVSFWIEDVLSQMGAGQRIELVILRRDNMEFIGMISVRNLLRLPEFGIWIKSEAQGQGYALEAMRMFLVWLGRYQPPRKYVYAAEIANTASIRLALRSGFKYIGEKQKDGQNLLYFELRLPQPPLTS